MWKLINEGRRKKNEINKKIEVEKWDEHLRKLLGGEKGKVRIERRKSEKKETAEGRKKIKREELEEVIKRLKKRKSAGRDRIQNEAWIYGGEEMKVAVWEICGKGEGRIREG